MIARRLIHTSTFLLAILTASANAENTPTTQDRYDQPIQSEYDQIIYKGLIGNALETVPMDPAQRVKLQRTNAVVSSTFSGRSLTTIAKLTSPVLLIGSIVWGLWAAANINSQIAGTALPDASEPASPAGQLTDAREAIHTANIANSDEVLQAARSLEPAVKPNTSASTSGEIRRQTVKIWLAPPRD